MYVFIYKFLEFKLHNHWTYKFIDDQIPLSASDICSASTLGNTTMSVFFNHAEA